MSDLGPAWLRNDLPQPIANAWHQATLASVPEGLHAAGAVEVALRCVTALQLSSLLAEGSQLPELLRDGRFRRPTLGSWVLLVKQLRDALVAPFLPELATWPGPDAAALLDELARSRNALAHPGQVSPLARQERQRELVRLCARVLQTLSWLRGPRLLFFLEIHPEDRVRSRGMIQTFRSWDTSPTSERATWTGEPALHHLYLASSDPSARALLDVEPFLRRTRLQGASAEALCLWTGLGERGDVRLSDDVQRLSQWEPLTDRGRLVPFHALPNPRSSEDPTVAAVRTVEPPTLLNRPVLTRPSWLRPRLVAVGALAVVGAGGATAAVIATSGPPVCSEPGLGGEWRFDTEILRGEHAGKGVRGHYEALFRAPDGTPSIAAKVTKTGYTQGGEVWGPVLYDELAFAVSRTGCSAAAHARLQTSPEATSTPAEISLRLARHGNQLIGLWRHEGEDWRRGRHSGAVLGRRPDATPPAKAAAFLDCVARCVDGVDPVDEGSEPCVLDCAEHLDEP